MGGRRGRVVESCIIEQLRISGCLSQGCTCYGVTLLRTAGIGWHCRIASLLRCTSYSLILASDVALTFLPTLSLLSLGPAA